MHGNWYNIFPLCHSQLKNAILLVIIFIAVKVYIKTVIKP